MQHPVGLAIVQPPDEQIGAPFFRATGAVCNLENLSQAAGVSGFLNAAPDSDGILRRVPMLVEYDGNVYPALSLAAVAMATGARPSAIRVANVNRASLLVSGGRIDRAVALDGKSNLLVRYRGPKRTFPYVSAADVLAGRTNPRTFADKLVFVGTTALGTREVVATPLDTLFAGVEVHATAADNLLQGDFLSRPEHRIALETQLVIGFGALAALLFLRFGLVWGLLTTVGFGAALWGTSYWMLSTNGTFLSPLYPTMGFTGALASMTAAGLMVERRRADKSVQENAASRRLMVQTLLSLTGIRDLETGKHSVRTQKYTRVLAQQLSKHPGFHDYLTPERVELLASLAPLHDIGKVGVPDRVLNKPGELTPDERAEMRKHPEHGRAVIENAEKAAGVRDDLTLAIAKDIVYTHHEWWNGTGYPQGLKGAQIPIPGRIMAVVDVYDAIRTRNLYHAPMSQDEAVKLILDGKGTHFDPGRRRSVRAGLTDAAPPVAVTRRALTFRSRARHSHSPLPDERCISRSGRPRASRWRSCSRGCRGLIPTTPSRKPGPGSPCRCRRFSSARPSSLRLRRRLATISAGAASTRSTRSISEPTSDTGSGRRQPGTAWPRPR